MDKNTHEMRLMHWTPIVNECRNSGMSVRAWCIQNNVDEKRYHYWQRRIRADLYDTLIKTEPKIESNFVQLQEPIEQTKNISSFKPDIVIHIGNSKLELSNTASEELLSKVLRVMSDVK
jgi:hypothetical protein